MAGGGNDDEDCCSGYIRSFREECHGSFERVCYMGVRNVV